MSKKKKRNKKYVQMLKQVQQTEVWKIISHTALKVASSRWRLFRLVHQVTEKLQEEGLNKGLGEKLKHKAQVFMQLVSAYVKGDYRQLPYNSLIKIVGGLLYFLLIPDFIPDVLPLLGFADDLAVLMWVANSVDEELEAFEHWLSRKS